MKQLSLSAILLLTLALSCSKKEGPVSNCHRVEQVYEVLQAGAIAATPFASIAYDDSARVKTVTGPGTERREYTYYADSITVRTIYELGGVKKTTYLLDGAGRVVRSRATDYQFQYNADGYLVAFQRLHNRQDPYSGYIPYTVRWEGGNLAEVAPADPAAPAKPINLSYYTQPHQELVGFNSPLWEGRVLDDWNMLYLVPAGYFGKTSRDLLKVALYETDDRGRIVTMADRWAFRYSCP